MNLSESSIICVTIMPYILKYLILQNLIMTYLHNIKGIYLLSFLNNYIK